MAAPIVTGVVALMLEARPELTPAQVKHRLTSTATSLVFGSPTGTGKGLVNAVAAVGTSDVSFPRQLYPVTYAFASGMYAILIGTPIVWRDLTWNGGVDSIGRPWALVSWDNVVWNRTTWQNIDWAAFNWSAISWEDISWEDISWEDISWETGTKTKDSKHGDDDEWRKDD